MRELISEPMRRAAYAQALERATQTPRRLPASIRAARAALVALAVIWMLASCVSCASFGQGPATSGYDRDTTPTHNGEAWKGGTR